MLLLRYQLEALNHFLSDRSQRRTDKELDAPACGPLSVDNVYILSSESVAARVRAWPPSSSLVCQCESELATDTGNAPWQTPANYITCRGILIWWHAR